MITQTLQFTAESLGQYLKTKFGLSKNIVLLNKPVNSSGLIPAANRNKVVISLINTDTAENFTLDLLISANFSNYVETLKYLDAVISFFKEQPVASSVTSSVFPAGLNRLEFINQQLAQNEMQALWAAMGTGYQPSVVFKVRSGMQHEAINPSVPVQHAFPYGLVMGTVRQNYDDPDLEYRILVSIPDLNVDAVWARLSNFYATSTAGAFFLPEPGDEVLIGFLNDDTRLPVILGSMYSSDHKPHSTLEPSPKNAKKAIVSKSDLKIEFDDENKILTLLTPYNNQVVISDKDKQITIKDCNQNSIIMSENGIILNSAKSISIQADEKVSIEGTQGVSIQSSGGDVEVSGINIKQTAGSEYTATGGSTAKINSGMELKLQSAMIMIN